MRILEIEGKHKKLMRAYRTFLEFNYQEYKPGDPKDGKYITVLPQVTAEQLREHTNTPGTILATVSPPETYYDFGELMHTAIRLNYRIVRHIK